MCARYSAVLSPESFLPSSFAIDTAELDSVLSSWTPRYNVCPTQTMPIATATAVNFVGWGFRRDWANRPIINVRSDTVRTKWRVEFARGRCLVLADGFTEPNQRVKGEYHRFVLEDERAFAFAGVADKTHFSILTCEANEIVEPVHNRMPVILDIEAQRAWLSEDHEAAQSVLGPYPAEKMRAYRVSSLVGSWKNDTAEVIAALD